MLLNSAEFSVVEAFFRTSVLFLTQGSDKRHAESHKCSEQLFEFGYSWSHREAKSRVETSSGDPVHGFSFEDLQTSRACKLRLGARERCSPAASLPGPATRGMFSGLRATPRVVEQCRQVLTKPRFWQTSTT